jgi:MFS family permease
MISFIVYVFWLVVFLASVFLLVAFLWDNSEENEDSQSFEKKKIIYGFTSIGHLNSWESMGATLGFFLVALLSAWFIDIFYLFLWISLFAVGFLVFGILSALGSDEEDFSSSIKRIFKELNLDKAKTYLPTYALGASFILIFAINGGGMADWDKASSSKSTSSSSSSNSSSSSKDRYSIGSDGHPLKNGEYYAFDSGYIAGQIFNITIAQGGGIQSANVRCYQAMTSRAANGGDDYYKCDKMVDSATNPTYFQTMRNDKTYK